MKIILPVEGTSYRNSKVKTDNSAIGKGLGNSFSDALKSQAKTGSTIVAKGTNQPIEYIVRQGDHLSKIGKAFSIDPRKIAAENGLTHPDLIYPGQKLLISPSTEGTAQPKLRGDVVASWYGQEYHQKTTASGEAFDMNKNTLAHRTLPFGTRVRLTNPENGKTVEGVVNDRGPLRKGREVDVSYALAKQLGFVRKGIARLDLEIM
jgi:rare lipoprotein A